MLPGPSERGWGWSEVPDGHVRLPRLQDWFQRVLLGLQELDTPVP